MNASPRNLLPGLILIVLGALFLLARNVSLSGWIWLAGIGAIFILAYFTSRNYGLLIVGCILAGLGLGDASGASDLGLGLGFIAIFAIDTLVRGKMSHWWPLVPGVLIAGNAAIDRNRALFGAVRSAVNDWWPVLLIALGVLILLRGMGSRRA